MTLQHLKGFCAACPPLAALSIGKGRFQNGNWWVKFHSDIDHLLAWNVVQELSHVLNYLRAEDRRQPVFMPVSPSPYLNGGPYEYLSWVIESMAEGFEPKNSAEWLEGRLPQSVEDS